MLTKKLKNATIIFSTLLLLSFYDPAQGSWSHNESEQKLLSKAHSLLIPFTENKGQIEDKNVQYYARTLGGAVFITKGGEMIYTLPYYSEKKITREGVIKENLLEASISRIRGEEKTPTIVNYIKGNDSSKWIKNIPTFTMVDLGEIYQGVELKLKAYGNTIEKIFYLKAGTDPARIKAKIEGAQKMQVNAQGELEVEMGLGLVKFTKPIAWQEVEGNKMFVDIAYQLKGNTYTFKVQHYDQTKELIIDPLLDSTYLGGTEDQTEWATSIARDNSGNIYVTGYTRSSDFPTTSGAYDTAYHDWSDVFVSKFDSELNNLLASTYFGGSEDEEAHTIAIGENNAIYVAGYTVSMEDFPTTPGAYDTGYNGYGDGFIAKFDSTLQNLLASTFLGAGDKVGDQEEIWSLAIGNEGNVFATGRTHSSGFPTTPGAYDPTCNECGYYQTDVFVSKLDSSLSTLLASTFLGGAESDYGFSLILDSNENVYVAGETLSSDFPTSVDAYDRQLNNGEDSQDVFIAKLTSNLQSLLASTYLGGSESDGLGYDDPQETDKSIALDSNGNVYVTGMTFSDDFPTTPGAYITSSTRKDSDDTFVAKLKGDLTNLLASSYLCIGVTRSVAIDNNGNIFIAGDGASPACETTPNAYQPEEKGWGDAYIMKFDSELKNLLAATFLGGSEDENALSLLADSSGNIYLTGWTSSSDFPVTEDAYDTTFNGEDYDVYVTKLDNNLSSAMSTTTTTTIGALCPSEKIFGEYSEKTELLRDFRDTVLNQTPEGQELIKLYYELSPAIIKAMKEDAAFKSQVKAMMDGVLLLIK
jgi:hypothetical protein